jgi:hypothetical protein
MPVHEVEVLWVEVNQIIEKAGKSETFEKFDLVLDKTLN